VPAAISFVFFIIGRNHQAPPRGFCGGEDQNLIFFFGGGWGNRACAAFAMTAPTPSAIINPKIPIKVDPAPGPSDGACALR
jgi:hypothetical protein